MQPLLECLSSGQLTPPPVAPQGSQSPLEVARTVINHWPSPLPGLSDLPSHKPRVRWLCLGLGLSPVFPAGGSLVPTSSTRLCPGGAWFSFRARGPGQAPAQL